MAQSTPSSPFYWNDYYRDTRVLSLPTRAIWMDMLCRMHESPTRGTIRLSAQEWARWCACDVEDLMLAVIDLSYHPEVGHVERDQPDPLRQDPGSVFITTANRRMVREATVRDVTLARRIQALRKHADRQQKYRERRARDGARDARVTLDVTLEKRHGDNDVTLYNHAKEHGNSKCDAAVTPRDAGKITVPSSSSLNPDPDPEKMKKEEIHCRDYKKEAREVLAFLNEKTGKNFRPVPTNLDLIALRLKSGVDLQTCKTLIVRKCRDWKDRPEMQLYLRPETLFGKTKFEGYLAEVT